MKLALNGATTMHADLETDIKAASAAGFDLIEIWAAKLREFLKINTVADLKKLLSENNLAPYSINSIEHITFRSDVDYANIKAETEALSKICYKKWRIRTCRLSSGCRRTNARINRIQDRTRRTPIPRGIFFQNKGRHKLNIVFSII